MEKDEVVIKNIDPFNEFFFIDCIYNSIFSILSYMEIQELPLLLNTYFQYEISRDNILGINIRSKNIETLENMLAYSSVTMQKFNDYRNLNEITLDSIKNSTPIVVNVDCYYEVIRKDTYLKEHFDHNLLIYGLNQNDFFVLEQSNKRILNFKRQNIVKDNLLLAAQGYAENYLPKSEFACSFFSLLKKDIIEVSTYNEFDAIKGYMYDLSFCSQNEILYQGMKNLKYFLLNDDINSVNVNDAVDTINKVINNKAIQKKIFSKINYTLLPYIEQTILGWNYLILLLTKYTLYAQNNNSSLQDELKDILDNVIEYEMLLNEQYVYYYERL